jgi:DNA-binding PadR family transcriptional regulator
MASEETDKTPKTMIILSLLAEQGPKTEYDLYKQLPKLSHGTIHFCLNKLVEDGAITYTQSKHKNTQIKKEYHLTFIGTVTHVASSIYWQTLELTDSQIEERWANFDDDEREEIIEFLARQGKLLKYAVFEESQWIAERYPQIARAFAIISHVICEHPPEPYKNLLLSMAAGKKHYLLFDWKELKQKMPSHHELIELLQEAYKREFTRLFFETIVAMKHNDKVTTNLNLRRQAKEELEQQKYDLAGLEMAIQLFGKQAKTK